MKDKKKHTTAQTLHKYTQHNKRLGLPDILYAFNWCVPRGPRQRSCARAVTRRQSPGQHKHWRVGQGLMRPASLLTMNVY